jgi:hypothetical protein
VRWGVCHSTEAHPLGRRPPAETSSNSLLRCALPNNDIAAVTQPSVMTGFHTREELAAAVGKSVATVRRWEQRGLPVIRRGNLRLYEIERVRDWLRSDPIVPEPRRPGRPRKAG